MADANHTVEIAGRSYDPDAVLRPTLLAAMFGPSLPPAIQVAPDGSAPASRVAGYLHRQGELGLRVMLEESEIVTPGTSEALTDFS